MTTPPIKPIEVGQTYRPTPYNAARLPEDRATVTTVYDAEPGDERTIAYDIATVDYRRRPITTHSAMCESVFRKCYVLDVPEPATEEPFIPRTEREYWQDIADALNAAGRVGMPVGIDLDGTLTDHNAWSVVWNPEAVRWEVAGYEDDEDSPKPAPESPADIVARAVALLDSLDSVTYAIVRPDTPTTLGVVGRTRGMDAAHGVDGLRSMADAMSIREAQRRMAAATVPGLPDLFARAETVDALKRPSGCACNPVSVEVTGTVDQAAVTRTIEQVLGPARATREQQRAKAKAQVLREAADDIESRNDGCNIVGICSQCETRTVEADRLRRQAADIEAAANAASCTCGVPTDPNAVHRTDAPCYVKDTDQ